MNFYVQKSENHFLIRNQQFFIFPFLGLCFFLFFNINNEILNIIIKCISDAYIQVSSFVAGTLLIFFSIEKFFKIDIGELLKKNPKLEVILSSFLGALPGCGGAIIVLTQYIRGKTSFGSVVATLTATMGDAAFLLLSQDPLSGLQVFLIAGLTGMITGYIVDLFHNQKYLQIKENFKIEFEKVQETFVSRFNIFWLIIFVPGLIIGTLMAFRVDIEKFEIFNTFSVVELFGSIGAVISIFMWTLNPLSDFQCSTEKSRSYLSRVIDTTNFVTTWVVCGFLLYEILIYVSGIDLSIFFNTWVYLVPLIAIFFGFIPGCGPQIVITTFYLNGYIPFSAELGNAISNDGDALFPAIALAPRAAIFATLYSGIPALIVAYSYMFFFE